MKYENIKTIEYDPETLPPVNFTIYRDGHIDRVYELKKSLRSFSRLAGKIAVEAVNVADTFIVAMNEQVHGSKVDNLTS